MQQRAAGTSRQTWRAASTMLIVAVGLAACTVAPSPQPSWSQFRNSAAGTGMASATQISTANVGSLVLDYTADLGTDTTSYDAGPVAVANGRAYVVLPNELRVFDAAGVAGCSSGGSPKTCTPLWTAPLYGGYINTSPAVANGVVFVNTYRFQVGGLLEAFDADGTTNCIGAPKVCAPMWSGVTNAAHAFHPIVNDEFVYTADAAGHVAAFDAKGVTNCGGEPKSCEPVWISSVVLGSPLIATDGQVLVASGGFPAVTYAFDPHGQVGCAGTPRTCEPLWQTTGSGTGFVYPAVHGGRVYAAGQDTLRVFDADGAGCAGTPAVCQPLWTGQYLTRSVEATGVSVAGDRVYVRSRPPVGVLIEIAAYSTNEAGCAGTPLSCDPVFFTQGASAMTPTIANGVLFAGKAFDASTPSNCPPFGDPQLNCAIAGYAGGPDTAVVGNRVYTITETADAMTLKVFRLP